MFRTLFVISSCFVLVFGGSKNVTECKQLNIVCHNNSTFDDALPLTNCEGAKPFPQCNDIEFEPDPSWTCVGTDNLFKGVNHTIPTAARCPHVFDGDFFANNT